MAERRWIFIPNSVTAIWKDKTSRGPRTSFRCCVRRCASPKTSCQANRLLGDEGWERQRMRLINVSYMVAHRMEAAQKPRPHHKSKPKSDFTYRKHLSRKPTYTHHNPQLTLLGLENKICWPYKEIPPPWLITPVSSCLPLLQFHQTRSCPEAPEKSAPLLWGSVLP